MQITKDINIEKYGFASLIINEGESSFYRRYFDGFYVELMISAGVYSIFKKVGEQKEMTIANRYRVETQEQFDFLVKNGRVGRWFIDV